MSFTIKSINAGTSASVADPAEVVAGKIISQRIAIVSSSSVVKDGPDSMSFASLSNSFSVRP